MHVRWVRRERVLGFLSELYTHFYFCTIWADQTGRTNERIAGVGCLAVMILGQRQIFCNPRYAWKWSYQFNNAMTNAGPFSVSFLIITGTVLVISSWSSPDPFLSVSLCSPGHVFLVLSIDGPHYLIVRNSWTFRVYFSCAGRLVTNACRWQCVVLVATFTWSPAKSQ